MANMDQAGTLCCTALGAMAGRSPNVAICSLTTIICDKSTGIVFFFVTSLR